MGIKKFNNNPKKIRNGTDNKYPSNKLILSLSWSIYFLKNIPNPIDEKKIIKEYR